MTRQWKWQQEQRALGLCVVCAAPAVPGRKGLTWWCLEHLVAKRERQRKTMGSKKRNRTFTYDLEVAAKTKAKKKAKRKKRLSERMIQGEKTSRKGAMK